MSTASLPPRVAAALACPDCHGALRFHPERSLCEICVVSFPVQNGIPVFLPQHAEIMPPAHVSNAIGADFEAMLRDENKFSLHLGAGGSAVRFPNCIEIEHKIFRHTDVVGDAHRLPFRDDTFDHVIALNVFEHLRDPKTAAAEIFRVLKPGGRVAIHTAFLQALHEPPHHYYNATEFGVREWFAHFQVESCEVSGNFGPGMTLAFLSANLLAAATAGGATAAQSEELSASTLGEWARFWDERAGPPASFATLQNLPPAIQARVAAGFELFARKPLRDR
ncbi:MAG: methyltransferase domain-containing protein [Chthoniobacterales bacterium]